MRKAQKAQLLDIFQTLREVHEAIRQYLKKCEPEAVHTLLSECQQSSIQVGTIMEESEGEDCPTVAKIEDYCEELYQVSLGLLDRVSAQKVYKRLNKALYQVKCSAVQDISNRLEVVFLPCKDSMFDSLESVWRVADADPDCDAYIIPIPYYDEILFHLPMGKRIVVNDRKPSGLDMAVAINLDRDQFQLPKIVREK